MAKFFNESIKNEEGFVLVVALLMIAIITVIGVAANRSSETELQLATNERQIVRDFYNAEGGLLTRLENRTAWMDNAFLLAGETAASDTNTVDFDNDGADDAIVEVRCIESTATAIAGLSSGANDIPALPHRGPPPTGSGYSLKFFEVRRYSATATSDNTQIQTGVWMVFNKSP